MSKNKGIALILAFVSVLLAGCGNNQKETIIQQELILPEEVNYETVQASLSDYVKEERSAASAGYAVSGNMYCKEPGARMKACLVVKGTRVSKGEPMVVFEVEQYETEIKALEMELSRISQALMEDSRRMLGEIELAKSNTGWLSVNDAELASLRIQLQQVQYEQYVYEANRQISLLKEQIAELEELAQNDTITAPYDGIVQSVAAYKEGELIDPDKPLVTVYATEQILLASKDTDKLRYHMPVKISYGINKNKPVMEGRVVSAPNILPSSVEQDYVLIAVEKEMDSEVLKRSISLEFEQQKLENVLMVDLKAVNKEDGKEFVYIQEDDMVKKRFVKTGMRNTEGVWILDGLTEGQHLILEY